MILATPIVAKLDSRTGLIVIRSATGGVLAVVDEANPTVADAIVSACNAHRELVETLRDIAGRGPYIGADECSAIADRALKAAGVE